MNETELKKLKAEIEINCRAVMDAIDQFIGIYGEKRRETTSTFAPMIQESRTKERMSQRVQRIVSNYEDNFAIYDICRKYQEETGKEASEHVRLAISQVINKLRHRNPPEITVIEPGRGSRSGVYKMIRDRVQAKFS